MIIALFILSVIASGVLYRLGGWSKGNTLYRDIGCPLITLLTLVLILGVKAPVWALFLSFGLMYGSMTTYHKWLNKLFGDSKDDVKWYGWAMHGFAAGFALMPIYHEWKIVLIRSVVLAVLTCVWSILINKAWIEEAGRGALLVLTLLLFI